MKVFLPLSNQAIPNGEALIFQSHKDWNYNPLIMGPDLT